MLETYIEIENYPEYEVSNFGNVRRKSTLKILKVDKSKRKATEYHRVTLCKDGNTKRFLVHRLVATHFIPNPSNLPEVNHIDNNGANNHVDNLEWVTKSENMQHSRSQGRQNEVDKLRISARAEDNKAKANTKYQAYIGFNFNGRTLLSYERTQVGKRQRIIGTFQCNCGSVFTSELNVVLRKYEQGKKQPCRACALTKVEDIVWSA